MTMTSLRPGTGIRYPGGAPAADWVRERRMRRSARDEIARGLFPVGAATSAFDAAPVTPTVHAVQHRIDALCRKTQLVFDQRAGASVAELRANNRLRAGFRARMDQAAHDLASREELTITVRRLQARINHIDQSSPDLDELVDREVRRARVYGDRLYDRGDHLVATYYGFVLRNHPQGTRLPLQPPRLIRPPWLTATTLDDVLDTLFPEGDRS